MKYLVKNVRLPFEQSEDRLGDVIASKIKMDPSSFSYEVLRRSIDARRREGNWVYRVVVETEVPIKGSDIEPYLPEKPIDIPKKPLSFRPVVVGFGPSGLFAALMFARSGNPPIVLERGKDVALRKKDIDALREKGVFDEESNVSYGEGGAGMFSDGKLNTGVKSPFCRFVLEEFVKHGAPSSILTDTKPHVGSDMLPKVMKSFREELEGLGTDILFSSKLVDLEERKNDVLLRYQKDGTIHSLSTEACLLCYGHSPFDTALMLQKRNLLFVPKDFSIGVRYEVPQKAIDKSNYHDFYGKTPLPSSSFQSVAHLKDGRALYSFCMCPGGEVVNSSSEQGSVVTNGMSEFSRDKTNGNAALLVSLRVEDYFKGDPLDGYRYREYYEKKAFKKDKPYFAPVARVGDFLKGKETLALGKVSPSYRPGFYLSSLEDCLPSFALKGLREGIRNLQEMQSFYRIEDAVLTGVETRSSSPVRIPRNERFESNIHGLYPAGEGASFAGGITSAAIDGTKVALSILQNVAGSGHLL